MTSFEAKHNSTIKRFKKIDLRDISFKMKCWACVTDSHSSHPLSCRKQKKINLKQSEIVISLFNKTQI